MKPPVHRLTTALRRNGISQHRRYSLPEERKTNFGVCKSPRNLFLSSDWQSGDESDNSHSDDDYYERYSDDDKSDGVPKKGDKFYSDDDYSNDKYSDDDNDYSDDDDDYSDDYDDGEQLPPAKYACILSHHVRSVVHSLFVELHHPRQPRLLNLRPVLSMAHPSRRLPPPLSLPLPLLRPPSHKFLLPSHRLPLLQSLLLPLALTLMIYLVWWVFIICFPFQFTNAFFSPSFSLGSNRIRTSKHQNDVII